MKPKEAAKVSNSIKQMILNLSEDELQQILTAEYLRRLSKYKLTDQSFRDKYGVSFEVFERDNVVAQKEYSWEAESDAQEWELAVDGIKTYQAKLDELQNKY